MAGAAATGKTALATEEARLPRAAAAGDGRAFAALYERYEQPVYNVAYRITGSEADAADATEEAFLRVMRRLPKPQDGKPAFGTHLFAATRNACRDLIEKRQPGLPGEAVPDTSQREVRAANMRLPERQREALALLELGELSYEEIAASMEMSPGSIAKLISRARINLSDDLHGTALAAVTAPSPECERALPLIAAREDEQLEPGSDDEAWLDAHLAGCERCGLAVEAMQAASASYRAWAPIPALPWLREETMAKAAALAGVEWSEEIAEATASPRRRRAVVAAGLAALLLGGGIATALVGGETSPTPDHPVAETQPAGGQTGSRPNSEQRKERRAPGETAQTDTAPQATVAASPLPPVEAGGGSASEPAAPAEHEGAPGLQSPQAVGAPKPKPTPGSPSQPASAPAPPAEAQPPAQPPTEEPAPEHPSKGRGPPAGVPRGGP